ncbi:MAG: aminotransferase class III-fold pyridoxal phosphate-dependent enzyme [Acidobacteriota bacterium]|nr:aminotransferase class III-fold pyridoxal phosphate-dependent enzyme [Acidobacteriota bacterium]
MLLESRVAHSTSVEEAARFAQEIYNLEAGAKSLPGEYDDNFHLIAADGREFVLKVMHPARDRSFINLQCQALQHLASRAEKLLLPRVVPTNSGKRHSQITAPDGANRLVWLLTFVPGTALAKVCPHTDELLKSLGQLLGQIDSALLDFRHPAAQRELKWDLSAAGWIRKHLDEIFDPLKRSLVENFLAPYEIEIVPVLPRLRRSVIYGDANDYNVLVSDPWPLPRKALSVIDFGDMHYGMTVSEVAIAAAYAMFGKKDVLRAAAAVVAGYHQSFPLEEREIACLYGLIGIRLAVSVTNSAHRKTVKSGDPYVTVSEAPAWQALERLADVHPRFAHYAFREACGLPPVPKSQNFRKWFEDNGKSSAPLFETDLRTAPTLVFDLSVGSEFLGADPRASETVAFTPNIFNRMAQAGVSAGVGRYNEARLLYTSPLFEANSEPANQLAERRTIHLGMDFFAAPGTSIHAPLDGTVHLLANNAAPLDYGPLVILKHNARDAGIFFTLYGHLAADSLSALKSGQTITRGKEFARIGDAKENGGWPPHLHFQIILDLLDLDANFPGVALPSQRAIWTDISPDPNLLIGIPAGKFPTQETTPQETLTTRRSALGKNLSISYNQPLKIVRGWMQHLYDETGRAFLDFYNNVPLVGHSHPHVVREAQKQLGLLNTNTRYLHDVVNRYAQRLTAHLPEPLRVCYFLNSGSEANELALRLARTHTRREDIVVLEHAYHGNTTALIDISPYKFDGPGGAGRKPWAHVAPLPDDYRGKYGRDDNQAGAKYAAELGIILDDLQKRGRHPGAFIAETLPSVGGQIVFPPGYLADAYSRVRSAGGVCIADEVQVGFGRLGTHFWGFETQNVIPDIVVLGKPIGNGFPLAAVITTPEIARSFDNGMEFFSTFGGNPVACAAGLAVLDVVEGEGLQENARRVGHHLKNSLRALQQQFPLIGDVRGSGLFLGLDLVLDRATRAPAAPQASYVVNRLRECGILTGTDGPYHNVIKLRPPLIISESDAATFTSIFRTILAEDPAQPSRSTS